MARSIIILQAIILVPLTLTEIIMSIKKGLIMLIISHLYIRKYSISTHYIDEFFMAYWAERSINISTFSGAVTSNLISYLSNREINTEEDFLRSTNNILLIITLLNLVFTFLFIHIYLKLRHSESISIAERSNLQKISSFISFRKLICAMLCIGIIAILNFQIHSTGFVKDRSRIPPLCFIVNFLSLFLTLFFLFIKKDIVLFIKRRFQNFIGNILNGNDIKVENQRRQAWT